MKNNILQSSQADFVEKYAGTVDRRRRMSKAVERQSETSHGMFTSFKKLIAFSLVELMISLITISCIAAAFTPVITKKLKKQDIALSIAQASEITTKCHKGEAYPFGNDTDGYKCELCTKTYCINCELTCPDTKYADPQSCTCKNCSENKTVVPDGCEDCKKCITCTKDACTKCEAGYFLKGLDNKTYTTCQKCGKTKGRDNHCFDGINELSPEYCDSPPQGYYCENDKLKSCTEKYGVHCGTCDSARCKSCSMYYYYDSSTNTCNSCIAGCSSCNNGNTCDKCSSAYTKNGEGKCVHCVDYTNVANCNTCSFGDTKCKGCSSGYYVAENGTQCKVCSELDKCVFCTNDGKCASCLEGYYPDNGICKECSISNCAICTTNGKCELCKPDYHLEDGACVYNKNKFECSDVNFIKIGKLCFTRKNMGDDLGLTIPATVSVVGAGSYCYTETTKCCWKGKTASICDEDKDEEEPVSSYSSCNRTVCSWDAAKEICEKFNFAGKTWRLPTKEEIVSIGGAKLMNYILNIGDNGLGMCLHSPGLYSGKAPQCSYWDERCKGGSSGAGMNRCMPHYAWTSTQVPPSNSNNTFGHVGAEIWGYEGSMCISGNPWHSGTGASVRCVTEME